MIVEELESQNENDVGGVGKIKAADKVTAVMHRVLPGIRHYSSWLLYSMESSISASKQCEFPMGMRSTLQDLWAIYSRALTTFIKSFDVADLPDIEYLLEEDEDTIGFIPFKVQSVQDRFMRGEKPKPYGHLVARHHPTQEMLGRIKDFLRDGLQLVGQKVYSSDGPCVSFVEADLTLRQYRSSSNMVVEIPDQPFYTNLPKSHRYRYRLLSRITSNAQKSLGAAVVR